MTTGAPDYTKLVQILGRDAAGNLVTVRVEPAGRIILLPYGTMEVDGLVDVNQIDPTRTIQGVDGVTLHTIAVDAEGRLVMLPYGWDGSEYRRLLVDDSGRMLAMLEGLFYSTWRLRLWYWYVTTEGTSILDHSEGGNDGVAYSGALPGVTYAAGKVDNAISLDGVDDRVEVPVIPLTDQFTFETWVYFKDGQPPGSYAGIVNNLNGYADGNKLLCKATELYLKLRIGGGDEIHQKLGMDSILNGWHHIVVTYDGINIKFYRDGVNIYTSAQVGDLESGVTLTTLGWGSASPDLTYEAVAWWKIKEAEGTTIIDHSDNTNNGTAYHALVEAATYADGKVDKALVMDGTDHYVLVPTHASIKPTAAISLEAWIYLNDLLGSERIISTIGPINYEGYSLKKQDQTLSFSVYTDAYHAIVSGNVLTDIHTWYHVVGTYDGANMRIYCNGELVAGPGAVTDDIDYSNTADVYLGRSLTWGEYLDGRIDEVRIFDFALSDDQVGWLHDNPGELPYDPETYHLQGYLDETRLYAQPLTQAQVTWRHDNPDSDYQTSPKSIGVDTQGRMEVAVEDLPYKDQVLERGYETWPGGGNVNLQSAVVPAGRVWIITSAIMHLNGNTCDGMDIGIYDGDDNYIVEFEVGAGTTTKVSLKGQLVLEAGDRMNFAWVGVTAGHKGDWCINGYVLQVPE